MGYDGVGALVKTLRFREEVPQTLAAFGAMTYRT